MIISENQIFELIIILLDYIKTLEFIHSTNGLGLSENGKINLKHAHDVLTAIRGQQSNELKEIE